jgi:hypothetical protein
MISWSSPSNIKLIFAEKPCELCKNFATFAIKLKHLVTNNIYYSPFIYFSIGVIHNLYGRITPMTSIVLFKEIDQAPTFVAPLDSNSFAKIEALKQSDSKYKFLDNSVLYAMKHLVKHLNKPVGLQMMFRYQYWFFSRSYCFI